jgi:hypothetical protein
MAENQQQQTGQQKGPFSPLQSGCAFVMLTNMMIYLGVVLFTFNLLDPSKIDASYLAKRGFTARPQEREEDTEFRQLSEAKREEQQTAQTEIIDEAKTGTKKEPSPASRLSRLEQRKHDSSAPDEPEKPKAALTISSKRTGASATRSASSRLYSVAIFPQASLRRTYSPYQLMAPRTVSPERYDTLPVEMAPGIDFPTFSLPVANPARVYIYTPPNPVPASSRGGLKLSAPPTGAEILYTNSATRKAETNRPSKDHL